MYALIQKYSCKGWGAGCKLSELDAFESMIPLFKCPECDGFLLHKGHEHRELRLSNFINDLNFQGDPE